MLAVVFAVSRSGARYLYGDGAVIETGFGEDEYVIRQGGAVSRIAYVSVEWVATRGAFVLIKVAGNRTYSMHPRELFPDDALERIRARRQH